MNVEGLAGFRDWVATLLPAVADAPREAIAQFIQAGTFRYHIVEGVAAEALQGDLLSELPFVSIDVEGREEIERSPAMILSASCDVENDSDMVVCMCIPAKDVWNAGVPETDGTRQRLFRYMYLPEPDLMADLGRITTIRSGLLHRGLVRRTASLTPFGYYLMVTKVAVHFLRLEAEAIDLRPSGCPST